MAEFTYITESSEADAFQNRNQYIKITSVDMFSTGAKTEIQGKVISGSLNINGDSAIRRTGSLQLLFDSDIYDITDITNIISIKKQIEISIGVQNADINGTIYGYKLGVFVITNASSSYDSNGIRVSVTVKDRMALLNGEISGTIRDTIILSRKKDGTDQKLLVKDIIPELLKLSGYNIPQDLANDDPFKEEIYNIGRWGGKDYLKLITIGSIDVGKETPLKIYQLLTSKDATVNQNENAVIINQNEDVGYQQVEYTWPKNTDLVANPGETIAAQLEKVKKETGNYEYFFDRDGIFHFREIQNGINMGSPKNNLAAAIGDILPKYDTKDSVYTFNEKSFITAFQNAPKFENIKNDIVCWGERADTKLALRYHLLIDKKSECAWYNKNLQAVPWQQQYLEKCSATDDPYGIYSELEKNWNKIYKDGSYQISDAAGLYSLDWFIDILDPDDIPNSNKIAQDAVEKLCIYNIGRREKAIKNSGINSVFRATAPDLYLLEIGDPTLVAQRNALLAKGKSIVQVSPNFPLQIGTTKNDAFNNIRISLNDIFGNGDSVTMTMIPMYWLEPNTRVSIQCDKLGINGDYMIKTISIPLTVNGLSTVTATRIIERI